MEELAPWVVELHLGSPLGLLGLALSAIGVFLAVRTLRKTRSAAEAAVRAVVDLRDSLGKVDRIASCTAALALVSEIKRLQRSSNWDSLPDRYSDLRQSLVQIRGAKPSLSSEHQRAIQTVLAQSGIIENQIEQHLARREPRPDVARINQVMSSQADRISEIIVEIRHTLGGPK
ncbi:MAG: hypothetical protein O2968_05160 [Acidobacteria bacterium]|nr:hypothetical protein [Acidobacteriota bacterium]